MQISVINRSPYELPKYETEGSVGLDLRAHLSQTLSLAPMERILLPTGLFLALPQGYEAQIRPRSGLALRKGLSIPNAPGTIDSDYRGEIQVLVINLSPEIINIEPGERIAQMVVAPVVQITWQNVSDLPPSSRGQGGFGSTGS